MYLIVRAHPPLTDRQAAAARQALESSLANAGITLACAVAALRQKTPPAAVAQALANATAAAGDACRNAGAHQTITLAIHHAPLLP